MPLGFHQLNLLIESCPFCVQFSFLNFLGSNHVLMAGFRTTLNTVQRLGWGSVLGSSFAPCDPGYCVYKIQIKVHHFISTMSSLERKPDPWKSISFTLTWKHKAFLVYENICISKRLYCYLLCCVISAVDTWMLSSPV